MAGEVATEKSLIMNLSKLRRRTLACSRLDRMQPSKMKLRSGPKYWWMSDQPWKLGEQKDRGGILFCAETYADKPIIGSC